MYVVQRNPPSGYANANDSNSSSDQKKKRM
jgi:hypothetical protein